MRAVADLKLIFTRAVSDGVFRRSLYVALVVGTLLNLINQWDAVFAAQSIDWLKLALTYVVPYVVCTYGAVSTQRNQLDRRNTGERTP